MLSATSRGSRPPYKETKGVFGRVGFREDEKKKGNHPNLLKNRNHV